MEIYKTTISGYIIFLKIKYRKLPLRPKALVEKIKKPLQFPHCVSNQRWILGEANEAVALAPPRKYFIQSHFAVYDILGIIMKLGPQVRNRRSIRRLFFLEITMILGEREIRDQSHIFFREHQVLEILAVATDDAPSCEVPSRRRTIKPPAWQKDYYMF